jgi:hypothetical protein
MKANPEGRITLRLTREANGGVSASVTSTRPLDAVRWFEGKTVDETLKLLPMLFRVCGTAQAAAATGAVEQARMQSASRGVVSAREMLVVTETLREHLLRIFTGWEAGATDHINLADVVRLPRSLSDQLFPGNDAFMPGGGELRRSAADFTGWHRQLTELVSDAVLGCAPDTFLQLRDADALRRWASDTDTIAARMARQVLERGWADAGRTATGALPELADDVMDRCLSGPAASRFVAAPEWQGQVRETGALARSGDQPVVATARTLWDSGLLTRILARLAEIASGTARLEQLFAGTAEDAPLPPRRGLPTGTGIGQAEAARGRLVHRVVLDGDQVADYRLLAPTEWNFHPRGVVVQALETLAPDADLEQLASLLVEAIDPCVGYDLEVVSDA